MATTTAARTARTALAAFSSAIAAEGLASEAYTHEIHHGDAASIASARTAYLQASAEMVQAEHTYFEAHAVSLVSGRTGR